MRTVAKTIQCRNGAVDVFSYSEFAQKLDEFYVCLPMNSSQFNDVRNNTLHALGCERKWDLIAKILEYPGIRAFNNRGELQEIAHEQHRHSTKGNILASMNSERVIHRVQKVGTNH